MSPVAAKGSGLLSQKDLMVRLNCSSIRTVQRFREEFQILPVDFYGQNPLFKTTDIERAIEARRLKRTEYLRNNPGRKNLAQNQGIVSTAKLRRVAGRARKGAKP